MCFGSFQVLQKATLWNSSTFNVADQACHRWRWEMPTTSPLKQMLLSLMRAPTWGLQLSSLESRLWWFMSALRTGKVLKLMVAFSETPPFGGRFPPKRRGFFPKYASLRKNKTSGRRKNLQDHFWKKIITSEKTWSGRKNRENLRFRSKEFHKKNSSHGVSAGFLLLKRFRRWACMFDLKNQLQ